METTTRDIRQAALVASLIRTFEATCEASEYTDTGEAWELLTLAVLALEAVSGDQP